MEVAGHSPLENLFCLLFRDLNAQVPQGLHDLLCIDPSCNNKGREQGPACERPKATALQAKLTIILFVQTLKHQPQFLLMVLKVMDKFLKVQLPIEVLVASLHNFLKKQK
jgi:hypothetical protein